YVRIFDTTLRDGEQSPGATMSATEKLEIARALGRLGVDVIEAGFPAASPDDLAAVRNIAEQVGRPDRSVRAPIICALARASQKDIEAAWEGVKSAIRPRIHTFLATSELHMQHKLRMSRAEVLERVRQMVTHARDLCGDVEFSAEDAGRSDPEFLWRVVDAAVAAGATTVNIPDTVGYTTPDEFGALIAGIVANVRDLDGVVLSVHCHDDLGLATANTLAGLRAGARQAEVTINGIGERAGNCALEEVVMALATRLPLHKLRTGIDPTQLVRTSRLVANITGFPVPPNKPIVGGNAFAHESGIHQDGMLKNASTYEIMQPETVGAGGTQLVLGKHSGRHAFARRLEELGYVLDDARLDELFARFKRTAERRKLVTDAELEVLVGADLAAGDGLRGDLWRVEDLQVSCGTLSLATASVRLRGPDGKVHVAAAVGTGPVDAAFRAIDELVRRSSTLVDYSVRSVTEGIDALAEVTVRVTTDAQPSARALNPQRGSVEAPSWRGHSADTDIVVASVKAYLGALNRMLAATAVRVPAVAAGEASA
ncbi:MAG: 2-isopropylmalate synthase, partial [Myxococcales bacterium]|nr:2-isopropylmalate synthase [Myxococcales bacterium]